MTSALAAMLVLYPECHLGAIERFRPAITLASGNLERHSPEPALIIAVAVDQVDAADVTIAVEDVIVLLLPFSGDAGGVGAAEDEVSRHSSAFGRIGATDRLLRA
jgi:hypothetical protein